MFNNINFILILIILCIIELTPFIITMINPKLCYGCTKIGKYHLELNKKLPYIGWFAYMILFIYFILLINKNENNIFKYVLILFCCFMIYLPIFPILNIITIFLSIIYKNPPFIINYYDIFPEAINIEKSSNKIINEFNNYFTSNNVECLRKTNPGFKIENTNDDNNCWRALYLKKAGKIINTLIDHFPNTIELLQSKQIHTAFFSILDPGVEIPEHRGYYKGYLRYHLGIVIPNNESLDTENNKAYIICGNHKYIWSEGRGVMFDDMYLHHVKNPTNQRRVVLYLDIKRNSNNNIVNIINDFGINLIENSILLKTFVKNQHTQTKINKS